MTPADWVPKRGELVYVLYTTKVAYRAIVEDIVPGKLVFRMSDGEEVYKVRICDVGPYSGQCMHALLEELSPGSAIDRLGDLASE